MKYGFWRRVWYVWFINDKLLITEVSTLADYHSCPQEYKRYVTKAEKRKDSFVPVRMKGIFQKVIRNGKWMLSGYTIVRNNVRELE